MSATKKAAKKAPAKKAPPKPAPRKDKGEGEAAVQARIQALGEPSRSILAKLHPLVMKHAKGLEPAVKWGFAVYMREGKMVLVAAPRKAYVSFGYTMDAGVREEPVEYRDVKEIDEKKVAAIVKRV